MKKKEYWKDKLADIAIGGHRVAIVNDMPVKCTLNCNECLRSFSRPFSMCRNKTLEMWGDSVYIEKPVVNAVELAFIKNYADFNKNIFAFVTRQRNDNGDVQPVFDAPPSWGSEHYVSIYDVNPNLDVFENMDFDITYTIKSLIQGNGKMKL